MIKKIQFILFTGLFLIIVTTSASKRETLRIKNEIIKDPKLNYKKYIPNPSDLVISVHSWVDFSQRLVGYPRYVNLIKTVSAHQCSRPRPISLVEGCCEVRDCSLRNFGKRLIKRSLSFRVMNAVPGSFKSPSRR